MNFEISTKGFNDIINITEQVEAEVKKIGLKNGVVVVFVPHQTCAITVLEHEPGLIEDLKKALEKIAPAKGQYKHNQTWGDGNGAAHIRASFLKPDLTIPIENGKLVLGTWQQIILIDFDNRPRQRQIDIKVMEGR